MPDESITAQIVNLLARVTKAKRPDDLVTPFSEAMTAFGFSFICYLTLRWNFQNMTFSEGAHLTANFSDIEAMVEESGRVDFDPVFQKNILKIKPFHLFELEQDPKATALLRRIIDAYRAHDIVDVVCVPVTAEVGDIGIFFLSARNAKFPLDEEGKTALHVICDVAHSRHYELKVMDRVIVPILMTQREQDVADLMVAGRTNKEIAGTLQISAHTVDTYIRRIFEKIGVNNRIEAAVRYALVEGLNPIK